MFVDWQSDFGMAFVSNDMIQLLYDSKFPNVSWTLIGFDKVEVIIREKNK